MFYVLPVNGKHYRVVLVLQVQYMTDRFQGWRKASVFNSMWIDGDLSLHDKKTGVDQKWQTMDGVITKAPLGGKGIGPNPIDRAKCDTKRSILVDGKTEHNSKIKHS